MRINVCIFVCTMYSTYTGFELQLVYNIQYGEFVVYRRCVLPVLVLTLQLIVLYVLYVNYT